MQLAMGAWSSFRLLRNSSFSVLQATTRSCYYSSSSSLSSSSSTLSSSSCSSSRTDLSQYLLKGCYWREAPSCHPYIGPVFIDRTPDGRGRGLFASRHVLAGDVLLLSNAFAASYDDPHSLQLFTKLVSIVKNSPSALAQLYTLAGSNAQNDMVVPPVSLFEQHSAIELQENPEFDETRVMHIMNINSFEGELTSPPGYPVTKLTGLWLLPSFINHSCSPNASRLVVREAMIIHASRDIQANEEITIAYTDVMSPLRKREEALKDMGFGFRCECKRCVAERSVEQHLQEIGQRVHLLYDKAVDEVYSVVTNRDQSPSRPFPACMELSEIFDSLRKKMSSLDNLTSLQKQWILAGYSSTFLGKWLVTGYLTEFENVSDFVNSTAVELIEAMRETVPGMLRTLSFTTMLAMVAQRSDRNLALVHRLVNLAMDECIRVYGKQKPEVTVKLMEQSSEIVPFF